MFAARSETTATNSTVTRSVRRSLIVASVLAVVTRPVRAQDARTEGLVIRHIAASSLDPAIHRFDDPHYIVFDSTVGPNAPLLLFLPGTGGRPQNTSEFANTAARQGYRVIGLAYVDEPAVSQVCPRNPDAECSERVRRKRIYGENVTSLVDDRAEESIVTRLTKLLSALDHDHPAEGWSRYLKDGQLQWANIAVSGLSQGAGMAAYVAQRTEVARVVLFSSPWDNYGPRHVLAPWVMHGNGATPADRWYAAYHRNENTADIIARAYSALRIPRDHVHVFMLDPARRAGENPFHPSVVANGATPRAADGRPAYLDEWRAMLGDVH